MQCIDKYMMHSTVATGAMA